MKHKKPEFEEMLKIVQDNFLREPKVKDKYKITKGNGSDKRAYCSSGWIKTKGHIQLKKLQKERKKKGLPPLELITIN